MAAASDREPGLMYGVQRELVELLELLEEQHLSGSWQQERGRHCCPGGAIDINVLRQQMVVLSVVKLFIGFLIHFNIQWQRVRRESMLSAMEREEEKNGIEGVKKKCLQDSDHVPRTCIL